MQTIHESSNTDRLQFLFLNLVGHVVSVHTADGSIVEGLFVSRTDDDAAEPSIMLSKTRNRRSVTCPADELTVISEIMLIPLAHVVFVNAVGVRVEPPAQGRVGHFRQTALEMNWADLPPEDDKAVGGSLEEEERAWESGKWDQFEANKKFGVKSTYKEDLYTTTLDKSKYTKEQMEYADRAAREIERSQARGIQHRIERGEDVEVDEGTLYSDVQRGGQQAPPAEGPKKAPAAAGAKAAAYTAPGKKPQAPESEPQAAPASVPSAGPSSAVAPSPNASSGKGFNVNAKAFVPPAAAGPAATGPVIAAAPVIPTAPLINPVPTLAVDDMLAFVAKAMESGSALVAPAEWEGTDEDYQTFANPAGYGGSYPPQHAMPAHHHHHHHHTHLHHHHHSMHHNQHALYSPSGQFPPSGQPSQYNNAPFRAQPSVPVGSHDARQPTSAVAPSRMQPVATAPAPKLSQQLQQPQQPVAASTAPAVNPAGPAPVSEEPRRSMTGSTMLSRGRGGHANPVRHEDPTPVAPAPAAPLGANALAKKKGGK